MLNTVNKLKRAAAVALVSVGLLSPAYADDSLDIVFINDWSRSPLPCGLVIWF